MPSTLTAVEPATPARSAAAQRPAERVRAAVLRATLARDLATKVACWDEYRAARDEALAVLVAAGTPAEGDPQL